MKLPCVALLLLLLTVTTVSGFRPPSLGTASHLRLRMSATAESSRLTKAKQLLQDFSSDLVVVVGEGATAGAGATTTTTTPNGTADQSTTVVSPLTWQNGHLQEGSLVVTRWAQGVKVAEPLVSYDPVAAERLLFRQPAKWFVRNIQIALPIGWWAACVVTDYLGGKSQSNRSTRATQLLKAISGLGPAIIKGGQALASRPDLLPSEYLEELQKLQDDVPRFSNQLALQTVERELGIVFTDVFELLQEEPVAAASIGQVYKARLLSNGDVVALKIQRPNCEEIIALDLYVLRWWSGVYNQIFKVLNRDINVQSIIDDFGELIYREIDYVAEAANAQRFNELYARDIKDVFVPKVYSELTTSKVLTMEWVDGFRLTDNAALESHGLDRQKLVDTLVQCSLKQILENGFFHADPHAGTLNLPMSYTEHCRFLD
jgi:ABC1 atypical kinase-like domain